MLPLRDHNPSRSFPLITYLLVAANIYGFWLELTAADLSGLIHQYALVPAAISLSDSATLLPFLTAIFLHGGWLHLISNMWFLRIFGNNVEDRLGKIPFLLLYLAAGLIAGFAQFMINPLSPIPILGASGAVAGILGAYLVYFPRKRIDTLVPFLGFVSIIPLPAIVMLGYWFFIQVLSGFGTLSLGAATASGGGVAFFAHIGGFITGLIVARASRMIR